MSVPVFCERERLGAGHSDRGPASFRRAVFLDKDGTLVEDLAYNVNPDRIRLMPGVIDGLRLLDAAGFRLIVVTNQSGVARGLFPVSALEAVERRLRALLAAGGLPLDGFYFCPHLPEGDHPAYARRCDCRKPLPGLIERAARERRVACAHSWMVGDILDDIEAGRRAGCRTVLVDNGGETEWLPGPYRTPHHVAADLHAAARIITAWHAPAAPRHAEEHVP